MTVRRIPLVDLRRDGGTQVRETMNAATVQDYADALAEGAEFPAVTVFFDGEAHWLADGFHRVLAHERAGLVDVLADVRAGSKRDALRFALSANRGHGLQMSPADKRRAVEILLRDAEWQGMSNSAIAKEVGASHPFVGKVRAELAAGCNGFNLPETRTGKDGKQYPAKKSKPADPTPAPPAEPDHPAVAAIASAPTRDALDAAYTAANGAGLSGHDAEEAGKVYQRKAAELRAQAPATTPTAPTHEQVDLFTQAAPAAASAPRGAHGETAAKETSPAPFVPPTDAAEVAALRARVEALEVEAAGLRTDNALLYASNEAFSEWAALMKSRIDRAPETVKGTVNLDRVRKLVELAGSPSENEARNAAMLACRYIRDHRVRLVTDNPLHSSDPMEKALRELHDAMRDAGIQS